ncbi:MAG TPA: cytochrome c oxidase assembly protein [Stellaceae bacterium]|nr:cytochrome c oxidase assembly protein [Stellaceae bacterium]
MAAGYIPYCGPPPVPGSLAWNLDPVLIFALLALAGCHILTIRREPQSDRRMAASLGGWSVVLAALISPLCSLGVALFSARVTQHMIIALIGAPLIAWALPSRRGSTQGVHVLWATGAFALALWFWHMPLPYDATFRSDTVYWAMHLSLFGSALWLARGMLIDAGSRPGQVLLAGLLTTMQMSLLGAVLTFSAHPLFAPQFDTTLSWGLTPLQDQQLGGLIMWVPSGLVLVSYGLWAAARILRRMEARETLPIGE